MNADKIMSLFEKGDTAKTADDIAAALGLKKATTSLRHLLDGLADEGKLNREVRRVVNRKYSARLRYVVERPVDRKFYRVA